MHLATNECAVFNRIPTVSYVMYNWIKAIRVMSCKNRLKGHYGPGPKPLPSQTAMTKRPKQDISERKSNYMNADTAEVSKNFRVLISIVWFKFKSSSNQMLWDIQPLSSLPSHTLRQILVCGPVRAGRYPSPGLHGAPWQFIHTLVSTHNLSSIQ